MCYCSSVGSFVICLFSCCSGSIPTSFYLPKLANLQMFSNSLTGMVTMLCHYSVYSIKYLGMIPNGICQATNLMTFEISNLLTCAPLCVSTITTKTVPSTVCVYPQDNALCGLIAATNIQLVSGYSQWSCSTAGYTSTNPCTWPGLSCNGMNVDSVYINNIGLSGALPALLCALLIGYNLF